MKREAIQFERDSVGQPLFSASKKRKSDDGDGDGGLHSPSHVPTSHAEVIDNLLEMEERVNHEMRYGEWIKLIAIGYSFQSPVSQFTIPCPIRSGLHHFRGRRGTCSLWAWLGFRSTHALLHGRVEIIKDMLLSHTLCRLTS